jgi:peptidoglycan/LPS O-acetylase OafA/YrhL
MRRKLYLALGAILVSVGVVGMAILSYIYIANELTEGAMLKQYYWGYLIALPALAFGSQLWFLGKDAKRRERRGP